MPRRKTVAGYLSSLEDFAKWQHRKASRLLDEMDDLIPDDDERVQDLIDDEYYFARLTADIKKWRDHERARADGRAGGRP